MPVNSQGGPPVKQFGRPKNDYYSLVVPTSEWSQFCEFIVIGVFIVVGELLLVWSGPVAKTVRLVTFNVVL